MKDLWNAMFSENKVYASVDSKEAVSNMLVSLRLRIASSVSWCARKVHWDPLQKLDPVIARIILCPVSGFLAAMDLLQFCLVDCEYRCVRLTASGSRNDQWTIRKLL